MKKVNFETIAILIAIIAIIVLCFTLIVDVNKDNKQSIQPEIIQELQEDSKFVKITIDIIKETEAIENE